MIPRVAQKKKTLRLPDGKGSTVHVLHGQLVVLGLLSQGGDPLLNICIVHILHVPEHGHHQTLDTTKYEEKNVISLQG